MFAERGRQLGWVRKFEHISPATGRGRPMLDMSACGVPFSQRFKGAANEVPVTEIENGHEFEIDSKTKLRMIWTPSLGTVAAPMHRIEGGVLKEELQLDAKPNKNNWIWNLDFPHGTRFVYQGPLDAADLIDHPDRPGPSWRPDWVTGSYAVFDATGFKVAHIYRPLAIDRDGKWVWGDLQLVPSGILRVTIPREFLDDAAYPVIIDPTVGFTSKGGTEDGSWTQAYLGCFGPYTPEFQGLMTSVSLYIKNSTGGVVEVTLGAYDNYNRTAAEPYNWVGDSAGTNVADAFDDWITYNLDTSAGIVPRIDQFIAYSHDTGSPKVYYDSVGGFAAEYRGAYTYVSGVHPSPHPGVATDAGKKYSAYGTYTKYVAEGGGGGAPLITTRRNTMIGR